MLMKWEDLPEEMKTDGARPYYDILVKKRASLIIKRIFDFVISLLMLCLLSPVFLVLAILIKLDSKGPVFYRQVRVTTGSRDFRIYKFRTMVQNADKIGSLVTAGNDARITKIGSKIRKCRLDELPQLLNVIKGEMSFVGTRPEVRKYVEAYDDEMRATLLMPAGITSLASINFKDEDVIMDRYLDQGMSADTAYIKYVLPEKMKYNLEYMKTFSFWDDVKLMIKTFIKVLT
ncbi:sugar transferase [Ihubacter massiliensis]|uniref:Sugar transferase n=1 Tax=Hominibacterium faecale TaxID=2839743 RepID=A0A9J6QY59_9FIRM|nr:MULTISPECIES: sugar transferase [Eubacteriales Family XIII. Incertae Sedis]MCO7123742.1 sugar transferase [Ihubacter massiliensis]MCU7380397.1 sugar transferase [Hominibacterium faecale]